MVSRDGGLRVCSGDGDVNEGVRRKNADLRPVWKGTPARVGVVATPLTRPDPFRRIRTESGMPLKSLNHSKSYLCGSDCEIGQAHKHLTKYI